MKTRSISLLLICALLLSGCNWFQKESTRPEKPIVMGISYIGVGVENLKATTSLYRDVANMKVVLEQSLENDPVITQLSAGKPKSVSTALLRTANAQLRFMQFHQETAEALRYSPVAVNGTGIAHVCFQVNRETKVYQNFFNNGASAIGIEDMVQISSQNPVYYAYAHDPEGILVEIEEVDVSALELEKPPSNDYRLRQISLATANMDRIIAFYSILFEEQNPRRIGKWIQLSGDKIDSISGLPDSEIEMAWFQTRNLELEIVQYHSHPPLTEQVTRPIDSHGYNLIMFEVSDLNKTRSMLQKANADIVLDSENFDGLPTVFARDPDGNLLGFQVSDAASLLSAAKFANNGL
jgi:catechol 2,3-dioxygenase-like lactoylglutathione lyase family enzyme